VAYCSNGSEHFSYVIAFIGYYEGLSVKINLGASEQDYHRELECAKGWDISACFIILCF